MSSLDCLASFLSLLIPNSGFTGIIQHYLESLELQKFHCFGRLQITSRTNFIPKKITSVCD